MDELNPLDTRPPKKVELFIPWEERERVRPPWVAQAHGETVAPPNEQKSNTDLADELVMGKRNDPIATSSQATPLAPSSLQPDEPSGASRTYPTSGGINL